MISKIKLLFVNTNVVSNEKEIFVNDFGSYAHTHVYIHMCSVNSCSVLHLNKRGVKYEMFSCTRSYNVSYNLTVVEVEFESHT